MKVSMAITVRRDDDTVLTRTVTVDSTPGIGFSPRPRMTKAEVRKAADDKVKSALNAMGVR